MVAPFELACLKRQPYREFHPRLLDALAPLVDWPAVEHYDQLAAQVPQAADVRRPRFVTENRALVRKVGGYERHVAELAQVPTRPCNWHDFFNMIVWAHFPKLRWALNSLHVDPNVGPKDPRNGRAPAQNLAATFDEAGMLVVSESRAVLEELQALRFKRVFWDRRAELVATTRFWLIGHGLLESLRTPHPGLAARSLLLHASALPKGQAADQQRLQLDTVAAARVHAWRSNRTVLDPVPVLAIPGFSDNDSLEFYDDFRNIRFQPVSRRPPANGDLIRS